VRKGAARAEIRRRRPGGPAARPVATNRGAGGGARAPAAHFLCCVTVCRLLCSESLPLGAACGCSTVTAVCALASRYLVTCARAHPRVARSPAARAASGVAGARERV